jgi:cell wall-associated NlpC family hydrolase
MSRLDPRRHAYRADLADAALAGRVEATRFAEGEVLRVVAPQAPLRRAPSHAAPLDTEALGGEDVRVFEANPDDWVWAQLLADGYVGWMPRETLAPAGPLLTHKVTALRTFAFAAADIKAPPLAALPLGARVAVIGEAADANARYALIAPAGAVVLQHLAPLDHFEPDPVAVAEKFLGTAYLWGGKTGLGLDCSGLVQVALAACGVPAPRDADMQEAALGEAIYWDAGQAPLRRGDLVFWPGHVGMMQDGDMILHANAHHMAVASEPLAAVTARFRARGTEIRAVRRLPGR